MGNRTFVHVVTAARRRRRSWRVKRSRRRFKRSFKNSKFHTDGFSYFSFRARAPVPAMFFRFSVYDRTTGTYYYIISRRADFFYSPFPPDGRL